MPDVLTAIAATPAGIGVLLTGAVLASSVGGIAVGIAEFGHTFVEETQKTLRQHGVVLGEPGADAFAKFIRSEIERWTPIVTTIKMK